MEIKKHLDLPNHQTNKQNKAEFNDMLTIFFLVQSDKIEGNESKLQRKKKKSFFIYLERKKIALFTQTQNSLTCNFI